MNMDADSMHIRALKLPNSVQNPASKYKFFLKIHPRFKEYQSTVNLTDKGESLILETGSITQI